MARIWSTGKFPGIRYRSHPSRNYGIRRDRYYAIYFRLDGVRVEEGVGWESAGWTENKVNALLAELRENQRLGRRPFTLKERRALAEQQNQEVAARKKEELLARKTFDEFWTEFYAPVAAGSKKEKTWQDEQGQYENWIKPIIGDTPIREISTFALERIKKQLIAKKRTIRTQHAVLATCRQVFNLALRLQMIEANPIRQMRLPRSDNRRQRFLSREEAGELLAAAKRYSLQLHDICLLSLHTGLRAGEIFNLRWEDIDRENETILVRDPKSGRNRYAYLTAATKSMLERRRATAIHDVVFHQANGSPLREVSRTFERIVGELGWNKGQTDPRLKVVFHTLRHTFASWLVQQGTPLYTVAKLMGHSTLSMTERYAHLAPEGLRAAVKNLENHLDLSEADGPIQRSTAS
jgi:integrase